MEKEEFYKLYPQSKKVDENTDTIRIAEEFAEFLRFKKELNVDTSDIFEWLGIDYKEYQKEVNRM
jgi:hypothetical protein